MEEVDCQGNENTATQKNICVLIKYFNKPRRKFG